MIKLNLETNCREQDILFVIASSNFIILFLPKVTSSIILAK